jgi:16S rRNA (adenine1518-N6/adenine1519-N6)-dimethyltransferase
MFRAVKLAFAQRRKTLVNALSSGFDKPLVLSALETMGLSADIRGERLSVAQFIELAERLDAKM